MYCNLPGDKCVRTAGIFLLLIVLAFRPGFVRGQQLPLGQWQSHFSYLSGRQVVQAGNRIYCSSFNGLFYINPENKEIRVLSKADGLHDTGISAMQYHAESKLLLLAYRSGNVDFVFINDNSEPEQIEFWTLLGTTPGLPADKSINRIVFKNNLAYLATDFGIVVLDPLLRQVEETYRYIGPNGAQVSVNDLTFSNDSLFAATNQGLLATSMSASVNRQYFANWKKVVTPGIANSLAFFAQAIYVGIPGKGLFRQEKGTWKSAYASESSAIRIIGTGERLLISAGNTMVMLDDQQKVTTFQEPTFSSIQSAVQTTSGKFWIADHQKGLLTNQYSNFQQTGPAQADTSISPRNDLSVVDSNGLTWTALQGGGILVKDPKSNQQKTLSTAIGTGSLPSSTINSLAVDNDGYVWFASAKGVGYFVSQDIFGTGRIDAILPVYGQRKLFSNEESTALAVESGNRKWIGTRNGLYLFIADGTELISKFTAADSPLPNDHITALRFDPETGLLFADTPLGMVSYQTATSVSAENLTKMTIFPNPVRPGYSGNVGIKGLTNQATVKITDISGRLIYETRSEGGTASWNLNDYTGRRARGGIYLVLVVSADGTEKLAGKLAVIN
ncbi:PorZ beta-propeller-like domain-containing protein [Dyadobacter sp. MSC1_007]|jgi:hypothetical protein|uniref:PorZ beta-propeller-like domain-containing protein n=1 Tax=Dyadobacter sp. MSC1_007 TaxID=2909264 RepID=UPI002547F135